MATTPENSQAASQKVEESSKVEEKEEQLPPLSDHDFKIFNHLAVKMDYFVSSQSHLMSQGSEM
jgi:hypothetical protein